jgi:hypothetical protein
MTLQPGNSHAQAWLALLRSQPHVASMAHSTASPAMSQVSWMAKYLILLLLCRHAKRSQSWYARWHELARPCKPARSPRQHWHVSFGGWPSGRFGKRPRLTELSRAELRAEHAPWGGFVKCCLPTLGRPYSHDEQGQCHN